MAVRVPPEPSLVSVVKVAVPAAVWALAVAYLMVNVLFAAQLMATVIVWPAADSAPGVQVPAVVVV